MKQRRYNLFLAYTLLFVLLYAGNVFSQWEKVTSNDVGTGGIVAHGSTVFLYGRDSHGKEYVYRSADNGTTWTNIRDKFPANDFGSVSVHGSFVFAVGIGYFYESTDDGITWAAKTTTGIPTNLAFIKLISDGSTLYSYSGKTIIKSTDNGSTWTAITINTTANLIGLDFAAAGNQMVYCASGLGAYISNDGGANWLLKNPSIIIGSVHAFNNEIYGSTYGMFKLESDTVWTPIQNGFSAGIGVTASTLSTTSVGNTLFTYYADVVFQAGKVYESNDNGNNWSEVGNNLPTAIPVTINDFLAATPGYLFCYIYSSAAVTGVYRYPLQTTAVENIDNSVPSYFNLSQNYPNPFNPSTNIKFSIPKSSFVTLKVYDVLGKEVANLVSEQLTAGTYNYNFDASKLTSGIYFYRVQSDNFTETKKMIYLR